MTSSDHQSRSFYTKKGSVRSVKVDEPAMDEETYKMFVDEGQQASKDIIARHLAKLSEHQSIGSGSQSKRELPAV